MRKQKIKAGPLLSGPRLSSAGIASAEPDDKGNNEDAHGRLLVHS